MSAETAPITGTQKQSAETAEARGISVGDDDYVDLVDTMQRKCPKVKASLDPTERALQEAIMHKEDSDDASA
jgi:hypothetical protein